ncbi:MAG: glucose-1-phosphate adenylyltransferase [Ruminococcaceae bacterium]|nr:glucose-1-phosphate adenylyltransferase [Oscillospiraceae bacterium]
MAKKKEMIAMLLAGGQGNRLYVLTKERAKPAVPFGGKYRIVDFTLSNCANSGIDTVGVLTQYRPLELNSYIGNGQPWDLDRMNGGVYILPPYTGSSASWYKGTANAIYQNINFIEQYDPEYVLVLSGDHVYKMDYARMLDFHKKKNADATIAVMEVPIEQASSFGIMNTNDDLSISEFEEKPKVPKSNKASMGIYIFKWEKLREYLILDEAKGENTSNDFGKDVIPAMLNDNQRMFAYPFDGYWKDVGTIDNLWEANMDLLNPSIAINIWDPLWRIYCRHDITTPHYIDKDADIENSMVTEGCYVDGKLNYSILFSDVTVEEGADVEYSVIMRNTKVGKGASVKYAIVADDAIIEEGAVVGAAPESYEGKWGIAVIGQGARVKSGQVVLPGEMIEPDSGRE